MIPINVFWDDEAKVWIAAGKGIGLILESESYDDLIQRVREAVPELAKENGFTCTGIEFITQNRQITYISQE
ncbi:protein of unknown function [Lachnospiraceae bacterium G41]|nr:protein of unknown function [Lachnospiraceae bacterium G41]